VRPRVRTLGQHGSKCLMAIRSSRKQIMIPTSFILKTEKHSTEGGHRRLVRTGNLHQCTDAENRAQKLPLCATFRGSPRSGKAEASRRMLNHHKRIGTGFCVVGRGRKKVANARGKVAQVETVVVHYFEREGGGRRMGIRSASTSMSTSTSRSRIRRGRWSGGEGGISSAPIAHDLENKSLRRRAAMRPTVHLAIKSFVIRKCIGPQELLRFARRAQKDRHS
jgi:hypothetical protein